MGILLVVLLLIIVIVILEFNKFIVLKNKIKQSKSSIEVYLNQRFDLIPNLVECVKGYAKHEEAVYTKIAQMRSQFSSAKDLKVGSELNSEMKQIMVIGENNPELKASEQFVNLQKNITKMENQLQAARRIYNGDVTLYNTTISTFPNNVFAGLFGFKMEDLFEIEEYKIEYI